MQEESGRVKCNDSRFCVLRKRYRMCSLLSTPYKNDGECPFCKSSIHEKGGRSKEYEKIVSQSGQLIGDLTNLYSKKGGRV